MTGAGELAMFLAIGGAALGLLFGPIGAAVGRRIGGRPDPGNTSTQIEEIREQVTADVDDASTTPAKPTITGPTTTNQLPPTTGA